MSDPLTLTTLQQHGLPDEMPVATVSSGLIEVEAIEAFAQRWDTFVEHAKKKLEGQGRIVDDWQAREEEIIETQKRELDHSCFAQHSLKRFGSDGQLGAIDLEPPLRPPMH